jgi:hypothetical protein
VKRTPIAVLAALGVLSALSLGCVSAEITQVQAYQGEPIHQPGKILVYDFRTDTARITLADEDDSREETAAEVAKALSLILVEELADHGIHAERATTPFDVPPDALAIYGELVEVDEGSRAKRTLVGFGYGASRIDTIARLYMRGPAGPEKVSEYRTVGASGKKPGILTTLPIGAAVQGLSLAVIAINAGSATIGELRSALGSVVKKTGDEWADALHELLLKNDWVE